MRGLPGLTPIEGPHPSTHPCDCPNCTPQGEPIRGKIRVKRLREQCARQGIKLPVRIQINRSLIYRSEQARHAVINGEHVIQVAPDLSQHAAHHSILHELRHAEQCEKRGGVEPFTREYEWATMRYGYFDNPYELDAELASHAFRNTPPILT